MNTPDSPNRLTSAQEHRYALAVTDALESGTEHLPYRITLRLEQARQAALSRALGQMPVAQTESSVLSSPGHPGAAATLARTGGLSQSQGPEASRWWRLGSVVLPLLIVISGLIGISIWHEADDVADLAEVDGGLVLSADDLPVSAIADRGFGVFLRNIRQ